MIKYRSLLILSLLFMVITGSVAGCAGSSPKSDAVQNSASQRSTPVSEAEKVAIGSKQAHFMDFTIATENPGQAVQSIIKYSAQLGGYLVESQVSENSQGSPSAFALVKVPQEETAVMADYLHSLGAVISEGHRSEDISLEYYDTEARVRVLLKQEERLLSFMDQHTGSIEELLAVEREITAVREKRESLQAQMNYLKNLTTYSQFSINLKQGTNQIAAPQGTLSAAKSGLIKSFNFMLKLFNWIIIIFFVLLPYLLLLTLVWFIYRWWKKQKNSKQNGSPS